MQILQLGSRICVRHISVYDILG